MCSLCWLVSVERRAAFAATTALNLQPKAVRSWVDSSGFGTLHIAPGKPWQNGFAESFHSRLRDGFLECEDFDNKRQAQEAGNVWRLEYNAERMHSLWRMRNAFAICGEMPSARAATGWGV